MELKDYVTIITGSGKGLGKAMAERFFLEGAWVALWDVDLGLAEKVKETLDPSGEKAMVVQVDITDKKDHEKARAGQDYQHILLGRPHRASGCSSELCCLQGRGRWIYPDLGKRTGTFRHLCECHRPWSDPDRSIETVSTRSLCNLERRTGRSKRWVARGRCGCSSLLGLPTFGLGDRGHPGCKR